MSKRAKVSRRKALATLASGALGAGAVIGGNSETATGQSALCGGVAEVKVLPPTSTPSSATKLISNSCCVETKDTLLKATGRSKTHLQPILKQLGDPSTNLLEYCVMIWGIRKDAVKQLEDLVTPRLGDWVVK